MINDTPNDPWFVSLPSCDAQVPCGSGSHTIGWEAGQLRLADHPDADAELVLAALGGEKTRCVRVAEAWARSTSDLTVLEVGPRSADDEITVGWPDIEDLEQGGQRRHMARLRAMYGAAGAAVMSGSFGSAGSFGPGAPGAGFPATPAGLRARQQALAKAEVDQAWRRRYDLLSLLPLGYGFQLRLAGQVAAAHADAPGAAVRPALVAAITGRLALVAEAWLGIDPDQVVVERLHHGTGWGQVELTGHGEQRRLRVALPPSWLARVWACGLALTGRHLVVGVEQAGWPQARVLALRAPGADPVPLDVHAQGRLDGPAGGGDTPHWEV